VKWFKIKVGYGFIQSKDGTSYFVHYSDIQVNGTKTLKAWQAVEFVKIVSDQGVKASRVVPI
jgi:cold shock protein